MQYVVVEPPKPEALRVLYLTASPDDEDRLRVDHEVREVQRMLRGQKYRDLVQLEHRPAATGTDMIDGLNDLRPHIVHVSGHGSALALVLENDDGPGGSLLPFPLLARILDGTDSPPTLVVLNACESLEGADELLRVVPAVIGMSESVTDTGAIVFAGRFYAAIASAQSVQSALGQARAGLELAQLDENDLVEARHRGDVDLRDLVLVRPGSVAA